MESQGGMCLSISLDQRRWRRVARGEMARQAHEHIGQRHKKSKLFSQPSLFSQERMAIATLLSLHRRADKADWCMPFKCPIPSKSEAEPIVCVRANQAFCSLGPRKHRGFKSRLGSGRSETCSFDGMADPPDPRCALQPANRPIMCEHI